MGRIISSSSSSRSSGSIDTSVSGFLDVLDSPCHVSEDCIGGFEDRAAIGGTLIGAIGVIDCCKAIGFEESEFPCVEEEGFRIRIEDGEHCVWGEQRPQHIGGMIINVVVAIRIGMEIINLYVTKAMQILH